MKKIILIILSVLYQIVNAQNIEYKETLNDSIDNIETSYKTILPEGIYYTKEDFINKTPSEIVELISKKIVGLNKKEINDIPKHAYFYRKVTDQRVKDVFAISYKGYLFFQIKGILSNRNKDDKSLTYDYPNTFVITQFGGENYLYLEAPLANKWDQALAMGIIGGPVGYSLSQSYVNDKGIVWDFKNNEFNIFRDCKDFNVFIKKINNKILNCQFFEDKPMEKYYITDLIKEIK